MDKEMVGMLLGWVEAVVAVGLVRMVMGMM